MIQFILGPLELTRRTKVLVWNDEVEMAEEVSQDAPNSPPSPHLSVNSVPAPRRVRRQSTGEFPPPIRRTATDAPGVPRPVPFARKFQKVHPGTTGVTVLEHLERLDAVEQSLSRLGSDEAEEEDVGDVVKRRRNAKAPAFDAFQGASSAPAPTTTSPFSPPGSPPFSAVPEVHSRNSTDDEEDLVALSKSTSLVEDAGHFRRQISQSSAGFEWIQSGESLSKGKVIVEVRQVDFVSKNSNANCLSAPRDCQESATMYVLVVKVAIIIRNTPFLYIIYTY